MSRRRRWTGFALALMALLGLGATLSAGAAHAQTPSVVFATADVTPSVVAPCDATTVSGTKWEPDTEVTISLDGAQGEVLATAVVEADGTFAATVVMPCDTSVGLHAFGIFGSDAGQGLEAMEIPISVVAGAGGTAATGSDFATGLGVALTLLALGIVTITTTTRGPGDPPSRDASTDA